MLKRLFSVSKKAPITVSDQAWSKMSDVLRANNNYAFLFSAETGGCNGFNYNLETINKDQFKDLDNTKIPPTLINKGYANLVIDPLSEMVLIGTTIDYIKEDYPNNIFESKFTFTPDKELATTCGCGVSFTPKCF